MNHVFSALRDEYSRKISDLGYASGHARDVFRLLYKGSLPEVLSKEAWKKFPESMRCLFTQDFSDSTPQLVQQQSSQYDQSEKFVLRLEDGAQIEMVLMPETKRITLCISSQVGCRQGCIFCHTGHMGLQRNLEVHEIISQIVLANEFLRSHPEWLHARRLPTFLRVTNVVFMGMGEPLDNVKAVVKTIKIMTDPYGLNLPMRKITVSTAGHLDGLRELLHNLSDVRLALSVHSPFSGERTRIMPINRKWPLGEVIEEMRNWQSQNALSSSKQRKQMEVFIQYTLLKGVNDSAAHAEELIRILDGLRAKINLIPLNTVPFSRLEAPDYEVIQRFREVCHKAGFRVLVRFSKGQDIAAACGQLVKSEGRIEFTN